jgi:hypothetical protein
MILTEYQVRFGLSSSPVFSRTDLITDSEAFYASVITLLEDPEEQDEVRQLLAWWDRSVTHPIERRFSHCFPLDKCFLGKSVLEQFIKTLSLLRSKSAGNA